LSAGALAAGGMAYLVLKDAKSAGFAVEGVRWYEYTFTQWRALLVYLRLYFLPVGQTLDHYFPISRTIFQYGSWAALLALLAVSIAAVRKRKSWGLISFGILAWLALLSPTSSVIPIRDSLVEHRMYLPMLGLVLATVAFAARTRMSLPTLVFGLTALLGVLSAATYYRNTLWSEPVLLWQEAVNAAPVHARPYANLSSLYLARGKCGEASKVLAGAPPQWQPDYYALVTWGVAESCLEHYDHAVTLFRQGFALAGRTWEEKPAAAEAKLEMLIGWTLLRKGDQSGSITALDHSLQLDPTLEMAYVYRGRWKQRNSNLLEAAKDYQRALVLNPRNSEARQELENLAQGNYLPARTPDGSN
jgi:tetratricopeptide (TPR) repeat protein